MYKSKFTGQEIDDNLTKINNINVDQINQDIENLKNETENNTNDITQLTTKTNDLQSQVSGLSTQVAGQQTQITTLQDSKLDNSNGIITSNLLADSSITSAKIVEHQVTDEKLEVATLSKINRALLTPTTTPTATELVGIDTNKAQVNIGIGDGLSLENGTLKASGGSGGNTIFYNKLEISTTTNLKSILYFVSNTQNFSNLEDFINFVKNKKYLQVTGIIADADFTFYVSSIIVNSNTLIINYLQDSETNYYEFTADEISNFTSLSQQI